MRCARRATIPTPPPITALCAPAIATLAGDDGPLQMSLYNHQGLVEITHPDYPGDGLIACRKPAPAGALTVTQTDRARR